MSLKIKVLKEMPDWLFDHLTDATRKDFDKADHALFKRSAGVWLISSGDTPLLVIGVTRTSLIGSGAEVWFLVCKGMKDHLRAILKFTRKGRDRLKKCYGMIQVRADKSLRSNIRLIESYGFTRIGDVTEFAGGRTFTVYELR